MMAAKKSSNESPIPIFSSDEEIGELSQSQKSVLQKKNTLNLKLKNVNAPASSDQKEFDEATGDDADDEDNADNDRESGEESVDPAVIVESKKVRILFFVFMFT